MQFKGSSGKDEEIDRNKQSRYSVGQFCKTLDYVYCQHILNTCLISVNGNYCTL